ncbi:hypothetical protein ABZ892_23030 [Streptomyces sp. NPDC046924]|uniref:hypothetical protein n=1 Tax=Streptomyces sp. NPDC046924 TaxID=3155136 RepID=UPI0033F0694A
MKKVAKGAVVGFVTAVAFTAVPALTSVAHADPSCSVSASGTPGTRSLTVKVTSNPCGRQVRAFTSCVKESGGTFTAYGSAITSTGSSKADCSGGFGYVNKPYGHEVNVPGQGWTRYSY